MISLDEGLAHILSSPLSLSTERVHISNAIHRVLAENVMSDTDIPSFDKTAMDGFAIRSQDLFLDLEVLEFVPAGKAPTKTVGEGQCSRIMTGAMIPDGADMVILLEHTEELENGKIRFIKESSYSNILKKGEDLKKGEQVLASGTYLNPSHIGILASSGHVNPLVYKQVKVGILATGSELVDPKDQPIPPNIRNSNSYQIEALCKQEGAIPSNMGIVPDDPLVIRTLIEKLLIDHEVVIFTGGASLGDMDFSSQVLKELGAEVKFHTLAIQPGKPVLFATLGNRFLFGLAGNPVSSSLQFELLVKPLLHKLGGSNREQKIFKFPMAQDMSRKKSERALFFPIQFTENMELKTLEYHGSAHIHSYEQADGIACFPVGKKELKKGESIDVRFL